MPHSKKKEILAKDYSNPEGFERAWERAIKYLKPPPDYTPAEWAEAHVRIPLGNAIPGPLRFDNAPYQIEPLNCMADSSVQKVTLMWGAQLGKTLMINCAIGYYIAHNPQSQMMMQPSQGDLHTWLETKLNPMVDTTPALKNAIAKPRGREGVNNQSMKSYPGGFLMFAWSGSPKTMRGRSAPIILTDEVDGYDRTTEGHPVNLLWQRAATFGDQRKLLITSTPTIKNASFVEDSYESGDQRKFMLPCIHCKTPIELKWSQVIWDKDEKGSHYPETAYYSCQECGGVITDADKRRMLKDGQWVAQKPFRGHASFHLSEMYSAFRKWSDIASSFLEKKATNDIQTFVNVSLAETYEEDGEKIDEESLESRIEDWGGLVPEEVIFMTAGVDVQDNRLEISIIGWGRDDESYVIAHEVLYGDPSTPQLWTNLSSVLFSTYKTTDGREIPIRATAIDSGGHFTNSVYKYAKSNYGRRVFAIKGQGGDGKALTGKPSKNNTVRCHLFPVGVDTAKDLVFKRLKIEEPGPGYVHFSAELPSDYFLQLTAEQAVTRFHKGFRRREYVKIRARNEALDCMVYSIAAYSILNINVNALADRKEPAPPPPKEEVPVKKRRFVPKMGSNFINGWR